MNSDLPYKGRWTRQELNQLAYLWGFANIPTIAQKLGRTEGAVEWRARFMRLGPQTRGRYTLADISRKTGYAIPAVKAEASRLGIRLLLLKTRSKKRPKGPTGVCYNICEEVAQRIIDSFAQRDGVRYSRTNAGGWGTGGKPVVCVSCGTA